MDLPILARRLRKLREKTALSQREMAKRLNMAPSTLAMYETGKRAPDYHVLQRLADFFNVTVDYLIGRSEALEIDLLDALEDQDTKIKVGDKPLTPEQRVALLEQLDDSEQNRLDPEVKELMRDIQAFFRAHPNMSAQAKQETLEDLAEYFKWRMEQRKRKEKREQS